MWWELQRGGQRQCDGLYRSMLSLLLRGPYRHKMNDASQYRRRLDEVYRQQLALHSSRRWRWGQSDAKKVAMPR